MSSPAFRSATPGLTLAGLLLLGLGTALPAHAQEDLPIPYSDEGRAPKEDVPQKADRETERNDRSQTYSAQEDPAMGLGAELVGGLILLDSSRGQGSEARATVGARATWDYGRLFADPVPHEGLFVDLTYLYTALEDGTQAINVSTKLNNLTLAPAFELPFGEGSVFGAYVQAGVGLSLESASFHSMTAQTTSGLRPLIQYGVGLRGRPLLSEDGRARVTFRLEVTRFRRGYMNDTLFLGSLGLAL